MKMSGQMDVDARNILRAELLGLLYTSGIKYIKNYMDNLYLCKDNKKRKAFRIKGMNNTIYVMFKKNVTKASEIPVKKLK